MVKGIYMNIIMMFKCLLLVLVVISVFFVIISIVVQVDDVVVEVLDEIEEVMVIGCSVFYVNNVIDEFMLKQQISLISVLVVVDNLFGVLINEGDIFGLDDWFMSIFICGFQVDLSQQ